MFFYVITKKDRLGLRIKKFNIMGVNWKNPTFREVHEKATHRE